MLKETDRAERGGLWGARKAIAGQSICSKGEKCWLCNEGTMILRPMERGNYDHE